MKRIFSGKGSGSLSPKIGTIRSNSNSLNQNHASESTLQHPNNSNDELLSPELTPIITLITAQSHRRYQEGVFMFLHNINSDGEAIPNRKWREVYAVLIGTQLAVWNIEELEKYQNDTEALMNASSKPDYINFTDSSFNAQMQVPGNQNLKNVIVVSTTLKNQYLLQYSELEDFHRWNSAFRLATFEYTSLQEAYTGALLSARGSKLSDIRTILADTKFDYEDWVSVRFGSGMPWKRCFAVIEQPTKKSKKNGKIYKGTVSFYKDEKKNKKTAMATITDASAAYALYPASIKMIDHSTMIKLEGTVHFGDVKTTKASEASVYFMPEQHNAVLGYDTLIRFLVPLLNTFILYGRPKRLSANKSEMNSLLFGLPVLPHVHYLEVDDLILLASNSAASSWLVNDWRNKIKEILARKLTAGYTGCGSSHGVIGAMNSPALNPSDFFEGKQPSASFLNRPSSPLSPRFLPHPKFKRDSQISKASSGLTESVQDQDVSSTNSIEKNANRLSEITQIYVDYSSIANGNDQRSDGKGYIKNSQGSFYNKDGIASYGRSNESLPKPKLGANTDLLSKESLNSNQSLYTAKSQYSDPYSSYKQNSDGLDENFDDIEILQNGVNTLSVQNQNSQSDPFKPDFSRNSYDSNDPKLSVPTISVESVSSPYTSGRISSPSETANKGKFQQSSQSLNNDGRPSQIQKLVNSELSSNNRKYGGSSLQERSNPTGQNIPPHQVYQHQLANNQNEPPQHVRQQAPPQLVASQTSNRPHPHPNPQQQQQPKARPSQAGEYSQPTHVYPQQQQQQYGASQSSQSFHNNTISEQYQQIPPKKQGVSLQTPRSQNFQSQSQSQQPYQQQQYQQPIQQQQQFRTHQQQQFRTQQQQQFRSQQAHPQQPQYGFSQQQGQPGPNSQNPQYPSQYKQHRPPPQQLQQYQQQQQQASIQYQSRQQPPYPASGGAPNPYQQRHTPNTQRPQHQRPAQDPYVNPYSEGNPYAR